MIAVNNSTMTSDLVQAYGAPDPSGGLLSASQGNMQVLPNGNVFLGWGSNAYVSESTADGSPVFYADFASTGALHYRAYKFNFTATPSDSPALYTYALNTSASTTFYVSWNGATEVASWTFYSGLTANNLTQVGNTKKIGFETVATRPDFYAYTVVAAVASNGSELRNSSVMGTFVPGPQLGVACSEIQCPLVGYQVEPTIQALTSTPAPPPSTTTPTSVTTDGVTAPLSCAVQTLGIPSEARSSNLWSCLKFLSIASIVVGWQMV